MPMALAWHLLIIWQRVRRLDGGASIERDTSVTSSSPAAPVLPVSARAVHWLSAGLIGMAVGAVWLRALLDDDDGTGAILLGLHRQLGLLLLLLWALRLALRWRRRHAQPAAHLPLPLRLAAGASHLLLYALLLAMPLLGWAMSNAHGRAVALFGALALPALAGTDPDLADTLQDWHAWGAWAVLGLVALHVAAALWHHWVRRDAVLASMLPLVRRAR